MLLNNHHMAKMSEANIAKAYSNYLQAMVIAQAASYPEEKELVAEQQYILSYDEFKEYYILKLVGKSDFVENLVRKMQQDLARSN